MWKTIAKKTKTRTIFALHILRLIYSYYDLTIVDNLPFFFLFFSTKIYNSY